MKKKFHNESGWKIVLEPVVGSLLSQRLPIAILTLPFSPLASYCICMLNLGCIQTHIFFYLPEVTVLPASGQTGIDRG